MEEERKIVEELDEKSQVENGEVTMPLPSENTNQQIKRDVRILMRNFLLYLLIFMGGSTLVQIIALSVLQLTNVIQVPNWIVVVARELDGVGYLLFGTIAIVVFYTRQNLPFKQLVTYHKKKMTLEWFVTFLLLFLASQFFFSQLAMIVEWLLNLVGLSIMVSIQSATLEGDNSTSMLLYAGFVGPLFEELLVRAGITLRFKHYGKIFVIIFSALLFGLFHMNLLQGFFAFLVGLILAFICLEFGWIWALVFHILNNYVLGELLPNLLTSFYGNSLADLALECLFVIGFVASLAIVYLYREEIRSYLKRNQTPKGTYPVVFHTISFWVFVIICLLISLLGVTVLPS